MLGLGSSTSALTIYLPPAVYSAGSTVAGEVSINVRQVYDEDIELVEIRLHGTAYASIQVGENVVVAKVPLIREDITAWARGAGPHGPDSDTLAVPFSFTLPPDLPPSFHHVGVGYSDVGTVRYSIAAVGVRKGRLRTNKRHRVPLAVVPEDAVGARIKAAPGAHQRKTYRREERIRKGLWGDYSRVEVELSLPDIPVLPLSAVIPYTISVTTETPPLTRAKAAGLSSDKGVFPPIPTTPDAVEFKLRRRVKIMALKINSKSHKDICLFPGEKAAEKERKDGTLRPPTAAKVSPGEFVPERAPGDEKRTAGDKDAGTWVQRATFDSTLRLDCPPSFALSNIECSYELVVTVSFPGIGNNLTLEVPVVVSSGVDTALPREEGASAGELPSLDLPPAYWDTTDTRTWGDDEKE
ncbi:uncharacterized protein BXZ73DRAFT_100129 [Epithele typhae]|uniref:uncharacterized protein n=1 Tax=Epithele typhae TaxID=378194 RepID=UPI0020086422|nr:uncharacterized protein BXZ73DRAFT_100129 [Epithele typhae]KAH9937914.1 hypothetical protein BXZ73DRAFT_100129 [Epithele typhae]